MICCAKISAYRTDGIYIDSRRSVTFSHIFLDVSFLSILKLMSASAAYIHQEALPLLDFLSAFFAMNFSCLAIFLALFFANLPSARYFWHFLVLALNLPCFGIPISFDIPFNLCYSLLEKYYFCAVNDAIRCGVFSFPAICTLSSRTARLTRSQSK